MTHPVEQQTTPHHFLVIDDHEAILAGIVSGLQNRYPTAEIVTAKDVESAEQALKDVEAAYIAAAKEKGFL